MFPSRYEPFVRAARSAAHKAGKRIVSSTDAESEAEAKAEGDYVTEVDRACEREIRAELAEPFPGIPMVGEEEGGAGGDPCWLVDPLDGTTNFLHGFPVVGVSIALIEEDRPTVGVVHAPFLGETYSAVSGAGAVIQSRGGAETRIRVSTRAPERAVVATGFPFRNKALIPRHLNALQRCLERFEDLRRPGAASLDLAWVAAGVFDGFFELGLSAWDVAAGALLVKEASGRVTDWQGGDDYLTGDILAGSPDVHEELLAIADQSDAGAATPPS